MKILLALTIMASISSIQAVNTTRKNFSFLRGKHHYPPTRELVAHPPKKSGGNNSHQSTYQGCLGYSDSELSESWFFDGDAPSCSWVHSSGKSNVASSSGSSSSEGSSGGSNSTINGGNSDYDSSYDGEGDKYGGEWDDDSDDSGGTGGDDGDGGDANNGGDDSSSENQEYSNDEIVISNEDVNGDDGGQYDPIDDFDIQACDTYENLWIWDLALSCDNMTESDEGFSSNAGCSCSFAEELMENNLLSCEDASLCPNDCRVCSVCFNLLDCDSEPIIPRAWRSLSALSVLYIVGAAVGMLLFGLVAYYSRRYCCNSRNQGDDDLDQNLLDTKEKKVSAQMLYMHEGDLAWRPLPSDSEYAASQQRVPALQPTSTMSTASTDKLSRAKSKVVVHSKQNGVVVFTQEKHGGNSDSQGSSSSYKSARESEEEGAFLHGGSLFVQGTPSPNNESTTTIPSTVNTFRHDGSNISMGVSPIQTLEESSDDDGSDNDGDDELENFSDEDHLFEDLSPRTMDSTTKIGD